MEEQVSRQFILSDEVDVIIDVADASALERNLYLTLQLLEPVSYTHLDVYKRQA